jgi:hypothetical protein
VPPVLVLVLIKLGINKLYTPEAVLAKLRLLILKLTGNANFPTTSPSIVQLQAIADALEPLIDEVKAGNLAKMEQRNNQVELGKEAIRQLSYDIQFQSRGDEEKIKSAGFEVRKQRSAPQLPGQVQNLRSSALGNGKIKLLWKKLAHADLYVIAQATNIVANEWEPFNKTTRCSIVLENLIPGHVYYFRVFAINSMGDGNPSDVVEQMCLK